MNATVDTRLRDARQAKDALKAFKAALFNLDNLRSEFNKSNFAAACDKVLAAEAGGDLTFVDVIEERAHKEAVELAFNVHIAETSTVADVAKLVRKVTVPIVELTDTQLDEMATRCRSMGASFLAHAEELERFKRERRQR